MGSSLAQLNGPKDRQPGVRSEPDRRVPHAHRRTRDSAADRAEPARLPARINVGLSADFDVRFVKSANRVGLYESASR